MDVTGHRRRDQSHRLSGQAGATRPGYRYGSRGLSERIAEAYGISVHTVHSIRDGYRHRKTPSHKQLLKGYTVPPERLERLRQYNERRPEHRAETPRPKLRHYYHRFLMNQR